jgi:hypothetical protein
MTALSQAYPSALRSVVELMPGAMETAELNLASVGGRERSNSTEKGLPWKSKGRLLSVFVAFSVAARITVRPKTLKVLSFYFTGS